MPDPSSLPLWFRTVSSTIGNRWRRWRRGRYGLLGVVMVWFCLAAAGVAPTASRSVALELPGEPATVVAQVASAQELLRQGRSLYEVGNLAAAVVPIQQAIRRYRQQQNGLGEAMALSNLALVQERRGDLAAATEAITASLQRLDSLPDDGDRQSVLAQSLSIQAQIQLSQGQAEAAQATWADAAQIFAALGNDAGRSRSQIHQAQALQTLGFHQEAIALLEPLYETLRYQPNSPVKVSALRSLGETYYLLGDLESAETVTTESLALALRLAQEQAVAAARLGLANILRAKAVGDRQLGDRAAADAANQRALDLYQQVAQTSPAPLPRLQARLNHMSLLIDTEQIPQAATQWSALGADLAPLPPSRDVIYARLHFAKNLMRLRSLPAPASPEWTVIEQILIQARQGAQNLGDRRTEAYALGYLGELYEQDREAKNWEKATRFTEQALFLAKQIDAQDMTYQWHWQLGRLLAADNQLDEAIAAYISAVNILNNLRVDLVTANLDVQFSFQEGVEPIHRQLVDLLLKKEDLSPSPATLQLARSTIESLQQVELTNFLREACLDLETVEVGQIANAAIIYPIMLSDRLEIILNLPNQPLRRATYPIAAADLETLAGDFYDAVYNFISLGYRPLAQEAYEVLIRPIEADLAASSVDTLVFVLDGVLRNLPMAALNDGEQFLVEKYSLALTPGLQLLAPRPLQSEQLSVVAAGLTEARQNFSPLPNVAKELERIRDIIPDTQILLNDAFTSEAFADLLDNSPAPIVHLATHGQFSSQQERTFVLTWTDQITVNDLSKVLRAGEVRRAAPIELLILSACETASGDRRAALGLAGVAIRAGARSTIASLWQVSDEAAALTMEHFYEAIANQSNTRAQALRQAQIKILKDPQFRGHPYYWAPFVLVGNWL